MIYTNDVNRGPGGVLSPLDQITSASPRLCGPAYAFLSRRNTPLPRHYPADIDGGWRSVRLAGPGPSNLC
jgi:hypothetical protein